MDSPKWLDLNNSMVVTVKDISLFYNVSTQKVRSVIKKLHLYDNKTHTKYLFVFDSYFQQNELKQIHQALI